MLPSVEISSAPAIGSVITFGGPYVDWLGLDAITLIDGFQQNEVLTPGGRAFVFGIPPGLSGYHLLLQGLTVPPSGGYCATDAHEIVFE